MRLLLSIVISGLALSAQAQTTRTLTVEDSAGHVIAGAEVRDASGKVLARSDAAGRASFVCGAPCAVRVEAQGFAAGELQADAESLVRLELAGNAEQVTVTAYRAPIGELESPVTTRVLTQGALKSTAAITTDGQIRQLPGVELFRRSSALVANPSSQGISLRALGSTSASRTLLTLDDVPLNDPVGAWIHWLEQPQLAVANIELLRGGASDLYGSSAIGGVVNVHLAKPAASAFTLRSSYGGLSTYAQDALAEMTRGTGRDTWGVLAAGGATGTDGYIQEAPWQRGPVDTASNVHAQNGLLLAEHKRGKWRVFVRGSGFNEARANGTPYQTNGTRLWRYATGGDWQNTNGATASLRLYGSAEHYRQTFSSISNLPDSGDASCTYRCGDTPTKFALIADNELGGAAHWSQPLGAGLILLAGADTHDVRAWDDEQSFGSSAAPTTTLTDTGVHQRDSGAYVEGLWTHAAWTVTAGARMDWFQNYDVRQAVEQNDAWAAGAALPQLSQHVFDPRVGVSRRLNEHWALSASGFRAFRAPSPSELYRATQVGNQLTLANGALKSERATGWETGVASQRAWGTARASYFLTEINRPISAVTINPSSSPILLKRENLGQITSKGVSVDFEVAPRKWLTMDGGYQYAHATVTQGPQDLGKWIPDVARNMASLNVRAEKARIGSLSLQSRLSGRQFDDDANTYLLHGYFRMDAYASHEFGKRLEAFAAGENLMDRTIEVAKTPTTTLGMRRTVRAGFALRLGAAK
jgi:outer membrane receptor protein involved in Fe transport